MTFRNTEAVTEPAEESQEEETSQEPAQTEETESADQESRISEGRNQRKNFFLWQEEKKKINLNSRLKNLQTD